MVELGGQATSQLFSAAFREKMKLFKDTGGLAMVTASERGRASCRRIEIWDRGRRSMTNSTV